MVMAILIIAICIAYFVSAMFCKIWSIADWYTDMRFVCTSLLALAVAAAWVRIDSEYESRNHE